jgi:hypothetical protein
LSLLLGGAGFGYDPTMAPRVRIFLLLLIPAAGLAVVGLIAGLARASAEPGGAFVDCGRTLFGRPAALPNPACSGAYAPLDTLSIIALTFATLIVLMALGLGVLIHLSGARPAVPTITK